MTQNGRKSLKGLVVISTGQAGLLVKQKITKATAKFAFPNILEILKMRYPAIEDVLQAYKKLKQRIKVTRYDDQVRNL